MERGSEPVQISDQDVLIVIDASANSFLRSATPANTALIVIDVQNDFTRGSMAIPGSSAIIKPINQLATRFFNVVIVTDWHPPGHISFASAHPGCQPGNEVVAGYGAQVVPRPLRPK